MYSTIHELPTQVTSSLDDRDATHWMKVYNSFEPKSPDEIKKAKEEAWMACKDLPSSFSFRIKASMDLVDKDREIIDVDSIKKHMDSYISYGGNLQYEHGDYCVGNIWKWAPTKENGVDGVVVWGNIFGGDSVYDKMREAFVKGKNSLSVAGEADRGHFQCDEKGCYTRRNVNQLMEISLCAVPANKGCTLEWYNKDAKMTKSYTDRQDDIRFNVEEYEIHKSYYECPMLKLKKSLSDAGFDAHATPVGVSIKMTESEFKKSYPYIKSSGLRPIWAGDRVFLNDQRYLAEISYKDGLKKGYIDRDGFLQPSITKSQFDTLAERGVLCRENGRYALRIPEDDIYFK